MKKYNYLWLPVLMFSGLMVNGQVKKSIKTDPVAQLKQLVVIPTIEKPAIKMVSIPMLSMESLTVGYDIKKNIDEAKLKCPLLQYDPTLQLEGERTNIEVVGLKWKTTNNSNGLYFDVERSFNDTTNFEKVNFVWSKDGENKEKYQLPDKNDNEAVSYYRVKLQMNNGNFRYSNTIVVKGFNRFLFTVYPNPVSERVLLNLSSEVEGLANISLFNTDGKMVLQQFPYLTEGINRKEFNINSLPAGVYMIKAILPDNQVRSGKLIKN